MRRGRVEVKRIENKIHRQVTFSKRRSGLLKKAHEISVLCDVQVSVVIFSPKGKLYHFPHDSSSMERVLERYESHSDFCRSRDESSPKSKESISVDYRRTQNKIEDLERNLRNLMGEDLEALKTKQLTQLEHQLENSLRRVRSRKSQITFDIIASLQKEEKALKEQKGMMEKMIHGKDKGLTLQSLQASLMHLSSQPQPCRPVSHGQFPEMTEKEGDNDEHGPMNQSLLPHWMRGHM